MQTVPEQQRLSDQVFVLRGRRGNIARVLQFINTIFVAGQAARSITLAWPQAGNGTPSLTKKCKDPFSKRARLE